MTITRTPTFDPDEPAIYVASLSDYNAGRLHGVWVNPHLEDPGEAVSRMLAASPELVAEEWRIDDYMNWGGHRPGEWDNFDILATIAESLSDHGEAFGAFLAHYGGEGVESFEDAYLGEWDSPADYAAEFLDATGQLAGALSWLHSHIDYDGIARDWGYSGDLTFVERGVSVFVFDNRAV